MSRSISVFEELVQMARDEPGPARLLTVLLKAEPVVDRYAEPLEDATHAGLLKPVAVKAHALEEVRDYAGLIADIEQAVNVDWHLLMIGVLPGSLAGPASDDLVDEQLKNMARSVHTGSGMDRYAYFDRDANPVLIGPPS